MGILDKVKQGAEQAMTMAAQAAERAKEEAKELNLKRQISNEEQQLGSKVVGLFEREEISHAELGPNIDRIRALRAELEAIQHDRPSDESGDDSGEEPSEEAGEEPAKKARAKPPPASKTQ